MRGACRASCEGWLLWIARVIQMRPPPGPLFVSIGIEPPHHLYLADNPGVEVMPRIDGSLVSEAVISDLGASSSIEGLARR
jgi:hypothetical protein